jgi:O-succinylbenzoate synthase
VKLVGFDLHRYELPLSEPLTLKGTVLHHREGLLLRLGSEGGAVGWGEASPLPGFSRESLDEAAGQLRDLAASAVGREITDAWVDPDGTFTRELDTMDLAPSVRFGFELALWALYATAHGKALVELVTPHPRATVPVNALISDLPDRALEEARRIRSAGYEAVKLKVGGRAVEEDVELVRALNTELGDTVALKLDANRAWSLEVAERFARGTAGLRFEYVEEPLADPTLLSAFASHHDVPVALHQLRLRVRRRDSGPGRARRRGRRRGSPGWPRHVQPTGRGRPPPAPGPAGASRGRPNDGGHPARDLPPPAGPRQIT